MKILFTSDLHGDMNAYAVYARLLRGYDCGVLAGDLLEEFVTKAEAERYGLMAADEPEELHGVGYDPVREFEKKYRDAIKNPDSVNRKGLERKRQEVSDVLNGAGKPIFFVTGNHDLANWTSQGQLVNIEGKKVPFVGYSFVGVPSSFKGIRANPVSEGIAKLIDGQTILVSHSPPHRILDKTSVPNARGKVRDESIGSKSLSKILSRTSPLYCLFGHVHEGFGRIGNHVNGGFPLDSKFVTIELPKGDVSFLPGREQLLDKKKLT